MLGRHDVSVEGELRWKNPRVPVLLRTSQHTKMRTSDVSYDGVRVQPRKPTGLKLYDLCEVWFGEACCTARVVKIGGDRKEQWLSLRFEGASVSFLEALDDIVPNNRQVTEGVAAQWGVKY